MPRRSVTCAVILASLAFPASAQDASVGLAPEPAAAGTVDGASDLRDALAAYVTSVPFEKKVLRVEPDAAGQRITLDPAALLSELAGTPIRFAPLSFVVSSRPDGTWNVFTKDPIDVSATIEANGQTQTTAYRQDSQTFKGVFSPELATFLSAESRIGTTTNQSSDSLSNTVSIVHGATMTTRARPAEGGGADVEFRQNYDTVAQTTTVQIPSGEGALPLGFGFDVGAAQIETSGLATAMRTRSILDLYAFLLTHANDLKADPKGVLGGSVGTELREKIRTVLPLWKALEGTASVSDVKISSLYGDFRSDEIRQTTRLTGISSNASLDVDMKLSGASIETSMMPPWGASLVPDLVELGFTISDVDLAKPLDIALQEADFTKDPPLSPEAQARIQAAFGAERIKSRIKPSRIRSKDLDIAFSGELAFAGAMPQAEVAIDVAGLDVTIATLQKAAATEPSLHQAVGMLQMAKGIAKPKNDGHLEWKVMVAGDGSVTVNGAMLKGPDDVPAIDSPSDVPSPDSDL